MYAMHNTTTTTTVDHKIIEDPDYSWSVDAIKCDNPQIFVTDNNVKTQYAAELRMWFSMMEQDAMGDKMKNSLFNPGYAEYRRYDEQARDIIDQAGLARMINIKGDIIKNSNRLNLIKQIISLIDKKKTDKKIKQYRAIDSNT